MYEFFCKGERRRKLKETRFKFENSDAQENVLRSRDTFPKVCENISLKVCARNFLRARAQHVYSQRLCNDLYNRHITSLMYLT